jgi:hypothetical protein
MDIMEGIAPFLEKEVVIGLKCKNCDSYASASFPLSRDFWEADSDEYCHQKENSLKNLNTLKLAGCSQYSSQEREELMRLGQEIIEEDLKPAFCDRKLYDRHKFASYNVAFHLLPNPGNVCIQFGHHTDGGFACNDIRLFIIRRLDPGFGEEASGRISKALKKGPVMALKANPQIRRQLDIDYVLDWIAKKRNSPLGARFLGHCSGNVRPSQLACLDKESRLAQFPEACRYRYPHLLSDASSAL